MNAIIPPVMTTNISYQTAVSDEVLVNRDGSTAVQTTNDLAVQLATTSPLDLAGFQAPLFATEAALNAATLTNKVSAWVFDDPDPDKNGVWSWTGVAWVWTLPLPYSISVLDNAGSGTPNAIVAMSKVPLIDGIIVVLPITATTTSSPVMVTVNGSKTFTLKSMTGNDVEPGGLIEDMLVLVLVEGHILRLVSDQASAAVIAAAEDAVGRAEAARDLTLQYRNEAVQGVAAPIFESVLGMASMAVPSVLKTIKVNGYSSSRDKQGGLYARAAGQPIGEFSGLAFRSADRFLPNGTSSEADGGWWEYVEKFDMRQTGQKIASRLANKQRTIIAFFGDSTVDGSQTTSWVANPVNGDGTAIGTLDHNTTAPNAYPLRVANILSEFYTDEDFRILNCGYSSRKMNDGWANANLQAAVLSNSVALAGSLPYAVGLDFGLNDTLDTTDPTWLDRHISETRKCCRSLMAAGVIPFILTCDPNWQSDPAGYDSYKNVEMVDAAKVELAEELGILLIDKATDLKGWMNRNKGRHNYFENQSDGLHGGDIWHAFKAAAIARHFMRDFITRLGNIGPQRISASDSAFRNFLPRSARYQVKASRDGMVYTTDRASGMPTGGKPVADVWIWNEDPDAEIIYRGVGNENYESSDIGTYAKPAHTITDYQNLNERTGRIPAGVGFISTANINGKRVDIPYRIGKIPYGLSRIRLKVSSPFYYAGHYELRTTGEWRREKYGSNPGAFDNAIPLNALRDQGKLIMEVDRTVAGQTVLFMPEADDFSNVVGLMNGDKAVLNFRAVLPTTCAIILGWVPCFPTQTGDRDNKSFFMLFRSGAAAVQLYIGYVNNGVVTFSGVLGTGTIAQAADAEGAEKFSVHISRVSDSMKVLLYEGWDVGSAAIMTYTGAAGSAVVPAAFVMGGLFANVSTGTGYFNPKLLDYFGKQQTDTPGHPEPNIIAP